MATALGLSPEEAEALLPITPITTTGDKITDRRLIEAGGKGMFTKELDEALLDGRIDLAVHSLKDLPTKLPPGLILAATPEREDPRDAFICPTAKSLSDLPAGAVIGTASLRRQAQTLHARPDLKIETLRGNVDTRLRKLAEGEAHATFLALSGLKRLGLADRATSLVDPQAMPPAIGQGALAITARGADTASLAVAALIEHAPTRIAITAERAFLEALEGSCRTPIAAHAWLEGETLVFLGEALTPDGKSRWRRQGDCNGGMACAAALGARLGSEIRIEAGDRLVLDT
jgi:hydroxymethylbilane synthase